jgi:hypothetical protein
MVPSEIGGNFAAKDVRGVSKRRGEHQAAKLLDGASVDVGAGVTIRAIGAKEVDVEELLDDDQVEWLMPRPAPVPPRLTVGRAAAALQPMNSDS